MSYRELVEETETHRAWIVQDECPSAPDWDGQAHILHVEHRGYGPTVHVRHVDYNRPSEASGLAEALSYALNHRQFDGLDWELAERYLRAFYDVVSFDFIDWDGDSLVAVVTRDLARAWGCAPEDAEETRVAEAALKAWQQYAEGDVWGVVVEEKFHEEAKLTSLADPSVVDESERDVWVEVDSCWGYYGSEDATHMARETLASYAKEKSA